MADQPRNTTRTLVSMLYVSKYGICGQTVNSLLGSVLSGSFKDCEYLFVIDHTHVSGRNRAAKAAMDQGFDYLLFLDSDMDWPPETLPRLIDCKADVACIDMWSRGIPSFRLVSKKNDKGLVAPVEDDIAGKGGVSDIDTCGMGCTLIRTDLLRRMAEKIEAPLWFQASSHSEDVSFCYLAKQLCNASIKCDFGLLAGHYTTIRASGQDFMRDYKNRWGDVADKESPKYSSISNME